MQPPSLSPRCRPVAQAQPPGLRPPRLRLALALIALGLLPFWAPRSARSQPADEGRPNIVLVMADDLDQLLGTMEVTPNIQRLVREPGISLERYTITDSICCPSRTTYLRGQYAHNHGVLSNFPPTGGYETMDRLGLEQSTLATWLKAAGYRTGFAGKYINGFPLTGDRMHIPAGWDLWTSPIQGNAYASYDYVLNVNGRTERHGSQPEDHITDVLSGHAQDFLRQLSSGDAPFFLMVTPYAPHSPADPAPRHAQLFPDAQVPRGPSFNEADVQDKPPAIRRRPLLTTEEIAGLDAAHRKRLQAMQAVDEMVAALVAELEAAQLLDRTLFIFTSDNGYHLGQHRLAEGKTTAYEEDIRVPFYARGPGIAAGSRDQLHLLANIDLAPTLAQLAGATVPDFVDGRSFSWLLGQGQAPERWRRAVLVEQYPLTGGDGDGPGPNTAGAAFGRPALGLLEPLEASDLLRRPEVCPVGPDQEDTEPLYIALREDRYSYIAHQTGALELYDNASDPYQLENLSRRGEAAQLASLGAWAKALHACAAATCRSLEDGPPGEVPPVTVTAPATPPGASPTVPATAPTRPSPQTPPSTTPVDGGGRLLLPWLRGREGS